MRSQVVIAFLFCAAVLAGCMTPRTGGGNASQGIDPSTGQIEQAMQQSDNPATESRQTFEETRETLDPATGAIVERTTRKADTTVGAAQDLAGILKEANRDVAGRFLIMLALGAGAWMAYRNQWPLVAAACALGSLAALRYGTAAAYGTLAASALIYVAYTIGAKSLNPTPLRLTK